MFRFTWVDGLLLVHADSGISRDEYLNDYSLSEESRQNAIGIDIWDGHVEVKYVKTGKDVKLSKLPKIVSSTFKIIEQLDSSGQE